MLERLVSSLRLDHFGVHDAVDILILAVVIYQLLWLIRGTRSVNVVIALIIVLGFYAATGPGLLGLDAVHTVLGSALYYIPFAAIVLFENPIRRFLSKLGLNPLTALLPRRQDERLFVEVALAAATLASKRQGALIVIERDMGLRTFYETGIRLDAEVSYDLLINLFTYNSQLHDGAVIIAEGRIKAASCYLPLTHNPGLSRIYGTRHRAAFGITEESDALAVVISEERGVISLVDGGELTEGLDAKGLQEALHLALAGRAHAPRRTVGRAAAVPGSVDA